jgi:hypothetical protein
MTTTTARGAASAADRPAPAADRLPAAAAPGRTALVLAAGAAVATAANSAVAFAAVAAGADPSFGPLTAAAFPTFTIAGLLAGYLGWRIVRARASRPDRVLRVLVPVLLLASMAPNLALLATGFITGTSLTGVVALMLMHVVVVAVGVPVYARLAPVVGETRAAR